ncbi:MAG TPA: tetratricopeptide repeat-containing protein [Gemmatimonadaceae bacterium]|nr:tetratricopeptide repeat-containing protein [Gemmatimonadaceae bacterium]
MDDRKRTCLVIMGFGKKTDFETGRTLDLDKSYRNMIKPAAQAAGLECIRVDEISHSVFIDTPYDLLLNAEVVIADLSTSNKTALYELGVRHALRPYTTIVIAERGWSSPFYHLQVLQYEHLGEGISYDEVLRFRKVLTEAILSGASKSAAERVDSPVYTFLRDLIPPRPEAVRPDVGPARSAAADKESGKQPMLDATYSTVIERIDKAVENDDLGTATALLRGVHAEITGKNMPVPPDVVRRLALLSLKSRSGGIDTLNQALQLVSTLAPETSNDAETLLLWGRIHARAWQLTTIRAHLDTAIHAIKRAFYLRNDYDSGAHYASLLNVRAAEAQRPADAVADFMLARRVRNEVLEICGRSATEQLKSGGGREVAEKRFQILAAIAEAMIGLERLDAQASVEAALAAAPEPWMAQALQRRIEQLQQLLSDSPLKHLKAA